MRSASVAVQVNARPRVSWCAFVAPLLDVFPTAAAVKMLGSCCVMVARKARRYHVIILFAFDVNDVIGFFF